MSEVEMLSQTVVLTLAGHDTTASSLSFAFYELARHPEWQKRIRDEAQAFRVMAGGRELQASDLDSFPCVTAVVK
jgi:cytochrome P450